MQTFGNLQTDVPRPYNRDAVGPCQGVVDAYRIHQVDDRKYIDELDAGNFQPLWFDSGRNEQPFIGELDALSRVGPRSSDSLSGRNDLLNPRLVEYFITSVLF